LAGFQKSAGDFLPLRRQFIAHLNGTAWDNFPMNDPQPLQPLQMLKDEFARHPQPQKQKARARRLTQQQFQCPQPTGTLEHRAKPKDLLRLQPHRFQPLEGFFATARLAPSTEKLPIGRPFAPQEAVGGQVQSTPLASTASSGDKGFVGALDNGAPIRQGGSTPPHSPAKSLNPNGFG